MSLSIRYPGWRIARYDHFIVRLSPIQPIPPLPLNSERNGPALVINVLQVGSIACASSRQIDGFDYFQGSKKIPLGAQAPNMVGPFLMQMNTGTYLEPRSVVHSLAFKCSLYEGNISMIV